MKYGIYILFLLSISVFRCSQHTTNLTNSDDTDESLGKITINLNISEAPNEVLYLKGTLSSTKYDSIKFDFDIQDDVAYADIEYIYQGSWHLDVFAYNSDEIIIYSGSKDLNILPGNTTIVDLYLSPSTGNLEIRVRWGIDNSFLCFDLDSNIYIKFGNTNLSKTSLRGAYPFWLNSKSQIGYHSPDNLQLYIANTSTFETVKTYDITGYGTFTFGKFSAPLNKFLFAVNHHGQPSLGLMDLNGDIEIITREYPLANPTSSAKDDWIYYLNQMDGTYDIYRMKPDQSLDESITDEKEAFYTNFSVSYDGNYVVAPKHIGELRYIAVIEIQTKSERTIDLTSLGLVGYTALTENNEYIYFVGGPNRDIYRIDFDGSNLTNLTDSSTYLYRPMSW